MTMGIKEAWRIAHDPLLSHATVTLDLAARVLKQSRYTAELDRAELAELKARLQRIIDWSDASRKDNPASQLEAINRLAQGHDL